MFDRLQKLLLTTTALVPLGLAPVAANPLGGQVVGGSATVQGQGTATVTVTQQTNSAIINWNTFNIGTGEKTNIVMPSPSSVQLDRATGGLGPSQILGSLWSNGRVFLVNPDGILFGSGAKVDTAGFLATTHDIANSDFMAGRYNFSIPGNPNASIVNQGTITAQSGGFAALVAPAVRNSGTITATLGTVALASGNGFTLDFYGDRLITLGLSDSIATTVKDVPTGRPLSVLVKNEGTLQANGGRVELSAVAARQVVDSVINNTGVIEANSIGTKNGMIVLGAATAASKPAGAPTQTVKVSGTLSAAGKNAGQTGGKIQITGEAIQVTGAKIDASGVAGGGTVLIGGDWSGGNPTIQFNNLSATLESYSVPTARSVLVDTTSILDVSATVSGNGGKAIVWADQATSFSGSIFARGGPLGGDGGFVETSGHQQLAFNGTVDTGAPNGKRGSLLLDPQDAIIATSVGPGVISAASVEAALATGDVVVTTGSVGSDAGDLTVAANLNWSTTSALTLSAYRNIIVNANITNTNADGALVNLHADNTGTGVGTVSFGTGASISTEDFVSIFFNPTVNPTGSLVNSNSYVNPIENYSSHISVGLLVPYMLVNTIYDLQNIQNNLFGAYALGRNIEAGQTTGWNAGAGFIPIGAGINQNTIFNGLLDGENHKINGLFINSPSQYVGLIGFNEGAIFQVGLTNANVTSTYSGLNTGFVGAIAGLSEPGNSNLHGVGPAIYGSYATGTVTGLGSTSIVGGVVGQTDTGIYQTWADVNVQSAVYAGGLVGWLNNNGVVVASYSNGAVTAGLAAGGLVGVNQGGIYQSYSTAAVSVGAGGYAGGLVGFNNEVILQSYATGAVSGSGPTTGGLAGFSFIDLYSYWDVQTSGQTSGSGSGVSTSSIGLPSADLKAGLPNGFNTTSLNIVGPGLVWGINSGINNGYPYLLWQLNPNPYLRFRTALPPATTVTTLEPSPPPSNITPSVPPSTTANIADFLGLGKNLTTTSNWQIAGSTPSINSASLLAHNILTSLGVQLNRIMADAGARNTRAIEYVLTDKTVLDAIRSLLEEPAATALYGPIGGTMVSLIENIRAILVEAGDLFIKGNYYEGTLLIINQVSSLLLDVLRPTGGGSVGDMLNVAGSIATVYTYGFFFGPNLPQN